MPPREGLNESTLRDFFLGKIGAPTLAAQAARAVERIDDIRRNVYIRDMDTDFELTPEMAVSLCDAVLAGELQPDHLKTIAFALMVSDHFTWDGDAQPVLAETIEDWAAPEINYRLTPENMARFKRWLLRIESPPEKREPPSDARREAVRLVLQTEKKWLRD